MSIREKLGETALELAKSENVQNKTAELMGMLFPYAGLTKKAVEMYISEIEKANISPEAKMIAILNAKKNLKKMRNQKKVADIALETAKDGTDFTEKSGVNEEWFERFMESASYVSAEEIQLIWGKILANEFEEPGSTPPNMIRVLSEITPSLAAVFRKICGMKVEMCLLGKERIIEDEGEQIVVPFSAHSEEFDKMGVSFDLLNELETLGVIKFEGVTGYVNVGIENEEIVLKVHEEMFLFSKEKKDQIPIGNVILTSVGQALQKITEEEYIPEYFKIVKQYFKSCEVIILVEENIEIVTEDDDIQRVVDKAEILK